MFRAYQVMLINKIDLLPHLRFNLERCIAYAQEINPDIRVITLPAESGEGMDAWHSWLRTERLAIS